MKHRGLDVPFLLYGTAWKEADTKRLTQRAIELGFRGIDTANQRKHDFEEAVGQAVQDSIAKGLVQRAQLFLQTTFSLLTANPRVLTDPVVVGLAKRHQKTEAQIVFRFAIEVGMLPLTGTTADAHMRDDLQVQHFSLTPKEVREFPMFGERTP